MSVTVESRPPSVHCGHCQYAIRPHHQHRDVWTHAGTGLIRCAVAVTEPITIATPNPTSTAA